MTVIPRGEENLSPAGGMIKVAGDILRSSFLDIPASPCPLILSS